MYILIFFSDVKFLSILHGLSYLFSFFQNIPHLKITKLILKFMLKDREEQKHFEKAI